MAQDAFHWRCAMCRSRCRFGATNQGRSAQNLALIFRRFLGQTNARQPYGGSLSRMAEGPGVARADVISGANPDTHLSHPVDNAKTPPAGRGRRGLGRRSEDHGWTTHRTIRCFPVRDACYVTAGPPRLGVDFGRVINDASSHPSGDDTAFLGGTEADILATPAMEGAFDVLARLSVVFAGSIWVISK